MAIYCHSLLHLNFFPKEEPRIGIKITEEINPSFSFSSSFTFKYLVSLLARLLVLHSLCFNDVGVDGRPAKLILYRNGQSHDAVKTYEMSTRNCKAGVFLMKPTKFSCACITGVWAFYHKYCNMPYIMKGGDNYCFELEDNVSLSQMIPVGSTRYPFESSLTHFREDFKILTKVLTTDDDELKLDALATFVTIGPHKWTIKGDAGETVCLVPQRVNGKNSFCLFNMTDGNTESWREIVEVKRNCSTTTTDTLEPYICEEIFPPNDEKICLTPTQHSKIAAKIPTGTAAKSSKTTSKKGATKTKPLTNTKPQVISITPSGNKGGKMGRAAVGLKQTVKPASKASQRGRGLNAGKARPPAPPTSTKSSTKSAAKTSTKTGTKTSAKSTVKTPTKSTTTTGAKTPTKSTAKASTKTAAKTPKKITGRTSTKTGAKIPTETGAKTLTENEGKTSAENGAKISTESGAKTSTGNGANTSSKTSTDNGANTSSKTSTDNGAKTSSKTSTDNGANTSSKSSTDNGANTSSKTSTDNGANTSPKPSTENGANTSSKSSTDNAGNTSSKSSTDNGANTSPKPSTENGANISSKSSTDNGANTSSKTSTENGANTSTKTSSENGAKTSAKTKTSTTIKPQGLSVSPSVKEGGKRGRAALGLKQTVKPASAASKRGRGLNAGTTRSPAAPTSTVSPTGTATVTDTPPAYDSETDFSSTTPDSINTPITTESPAQDLCKTGFEPQDVREYWNSPAAKVCPRSMTEMAFTDQLKRFAVLQMNRKVETRQTSLRQTEELLSMGADLIKITCPSYALPPDFVDVMTEAFAMFVRDDFFYGVEETEASVFERIAFDLRTCIKDARPFEFTSSSPECSSTKKLGYVVIDGVPKKVVVNEQNSWRNYEPLIEATWKIFLNAHSYCYEKFLRQNDHHTYAVRMMQLFSVSIYEKWVQPLKETELYNYIVPHAENLEVMMDNLDICVGSLNFDTKCPVWLNREEPSQKETVYAGIDRKKRSIWINHFKGNREATEIWNGAGSCLQDPEDPSYLLGFGRCAHP